MDKGKIYIVWAIWNEYPFSPYEFHVLAHSPEEAALRLMNHDKNLRVKSVHAASKSDRYLEMPSDWKPEHTETQFRVLKRFDNDYHKDSWKSTEFVFKSRAEADLYAIWYNSLPQCREAIVVEELVGFSELGESWEKNLEELASKIGRDSCGC